MPVETVSMKLKATRMKPGSMALCVKGKTIGIKHQKQEVVMKRSVSLLLCFFAFIAFTACASEHAYWREAVKMREGVKIRELSLKEPRLMKAWVARIDLKTPGIGFVTTERAREWGRPMPDYTNSVMLIRAKREKTVDFMKRKRAEGRNVEIAINTAPWLPWCSPWTHKWGDPKRWVVSDGVEVCAGKAPGQGALFVVYKDGRAEITSHVAPEVRRDVSHVHPGFAIIATNGVSVTSRNPKGLHPRTALGISGDGRYLYLLVVDGRQPGYSLGASIKDLCDILVAAGASDIVNMDGGGSTSLVVFDAKTKKPRMLNRHRHNVMRNVAINLGITFD